MKILKYFFVVLLFSSSILSQSVQKLIEEGDEFAEVKFDNENALKKYLEADKLSPNNWEVNWRISRAYVDIAEHMPSSTDEQKKQQLAKYELALEYAIKSVKLAPDQAITYLRRAIANGRIALFKGVFSVIGLVNDVKADCEKALKLGNGGKNVQATVYYVFARTHHKVCEKPYLLRLPLGLGWGDMDKAFEYYKKAIDLRPDFRMFHLDLAKAYISEENYKEARVHLNKIPSLKVQDEDDEKYLQEARKLLDEIKNK